MDGFEIGGGGMQQRYVFLHYHIFKNGGSTVDSILEKNFPEGFDTLHKPISRGKVSNEEIIEHVRARPGLVALSSHHFRLPFPTHEAIRFIEIAFLRHPLDRLQSMYFYYRRIEDPSALQSTKAAHLSLAEWLRWMIEFEPFNMISGQTAYFGPVGAWSSPPTEVNLSKAKSVVKRIRFLGVVERFDESLVAAERFLRIYFPTLDVSYLAVNARSDRDDDLRHRLEQMRATCGDEVFEEMSRLNRLDVELWESANQELDRRLSYIPGLQDKLAHFQQRCAKLADADGHANILQRAG